MFLFRIRRMPAIALRRLGFGANPMRRRSDRVEGIAYGVALLGAMATIGLAPSFAVNTYQQESRTAAVQRTERHQTQATLLEAAIPSGTSTTGVRGTSFVLVAWKTPDGARHTDRAKIDTDLPAGATTPVWVDRDGKLVTAPKTPTGVFFAALTAGVWLSFVGVVAAALFYWTVRLILDRSRLRDWDREWAGMENGWPRQVRPNDT